MNEIETASSFEENSSDIIVEAKPKKSGVASIYEYLEIFCYALALMMFMLIFVFRYVSVDGGSMLATLEDKDKLIISNLFYTPETGDIVVINPESHSESQEPIIKRVIATEGQTVFIDYANWAVYVDGEKLDEPYIEAMRPKTITGDIDYSIWMDGTDVEKYTREFVVGKDMVFVMGDNRNNSKDSRSSEYGEMNVNRILGRAILRLSPEFGFVE